MSGPGEIGHCPDLTVSANARRKLGKPGSLPFPTARSLSPSDAFLCSFATARLQKQTARQVLQGTPLSTRQAG